MAIPNVNGGPNIVKHYIVQGSSPFFVDFVLGNFSEEELEIVKKISEDILKLIENVFFDDFRLVRELKLKKDPCC